MPVQIGTKPDHDFNEPLGLLSDCHRRIEHFLGVLLRVAARGGAGLSATESGALSSALVYFREAAPRHTADEEVSLFPRLRASNNAEVKQSLAEVARLEADHAHADRLHREVDELGSEWLHAGRLEPAQATQMKAALEELQTIYTAHIQVEDTRVFPLAGRVLDHAAQQEIGREMAARRSIGLTHIAGPNRP